MTAQTPSPKDRVSQRIMERLEDLGLSARDFARKMGRGDGWINGIKTRRNALQLEDLDRAAYHLRLTASDLVRRGDELFDLRPTESRMVRAIRLLPPVIQDYIVTLTEYLVGVTPDEVDHLTAFRALPEKKREAIRYWTKVLTLGGDDERALPDLSDLPRIGAGSKLPTRAPAHGHRRKG